MSETSTSRSFYRIARRFSPAADEYSTMYDKRGDPPPGTPPDVQEAWPGLSAYDTAEGARKQAIKRRGKLGHMIVRYDIPVGADITWQPSFGPGHYTLYGAKEVLERYLVRDWVVEI